MRSMSPLVVVATFSSRIASCRVHLLFCSHLKTGSQFDYYNRGRKKGVGGFGGAGDLVEAAGEASFIAMEEEHGPAVVGHVDPRDGHAAIGRAFGEFAVGPVHLALHGEFEDAGFDGPRALEAPAAGGEFVHEVELDLA